MATVDIDLGNGKTVSVVPSGRARGALRRILIEHGLPSAPDAPGDGAGPEALAAYAADMARHINLTVAMMQEYLPEILEHGAGINGWQGFGEPEPPCVPSDLDTCLDDEEQQALVLGLSDALYAKQAAVVAATELGEADPIPAPPEPEPDEASSSG